VNEINGRQFSDQLLAELFRHIDAGAARPQLRRLVTDAQGRGVSNATLAAVRAAHLRLRRTQGYALRPHQRVALRETPDSPLPKLRQLPRGAAEIGRSKLPPQLSPGRRPAPPSELNTRLAVEFSQVDNEGRVIAHRIEVFDVGPGHAPLGEQVRDAQRSDTGSLLAPASEADTSLGPRGYAILAVGDPGSGEISLVR